MWKSGDHWCHTELTVRGIWFLSKFKYCKLWQRWEVRKKTGKSFQSWEGIINWIRVQQTLRTLYLEDTQVCLLFYLRIYRRRCRRRERKDQWGCVFYIGTWQLSLRGMTRRVTHNLNRSKCINNYRNRRVKRQNMIRTAELHSGAIDGASRTAEKDRY